MKSIMLLTGVLCVLIGFALSSCGGTSTEEEAISLGQATARMCYEIKSEIQRKYSDLDSYDAVDLGSYGYMLALAQDFCAEKEK